MEIVLVGAPGSGTRTVGRALAEHRRARFVDLTGAPGRHVDSVAGLVAENTQNPAPELRRVIAADRIVADPAVRAQLYRGRHVAWLDVPVEQLFERLRVARFQDHGIQGDLRVFIAKHLAEYRPFYFAGTRIDASGSINDTIGQMDPILETLPQPGALVLRAELHGGLLELGEGILGPSLAHVMQRLAATRGVVLTSPGSRDQAADAVTDLRAATDVHVDIEELPDGEPSKRLDEQERLFRRMAERHLGRRDPLVALGDDALLESATFAAAVWLRGVPLITVPVTTLGLIDTAIGGKGGIDLPGVGRNLLGSIHQPAATILDVALVADESVADRRAALAEAVKYGLIGDDRLLAILESSPLVPTDRPWPRGSRLLELVERCALAKRDVVMVDARDTGDVRAALNLGHTVSHALEAATGYGMRHGDAVAYGLRVALDIGQAMGVTPPATAARAERLLDRLGLGRDSLSVTVEEVVGYVAADKKRRDQRLRWVLVAERGVVLRDDVPPDLIRAAIARALGADGDNDVAHP